VFNRKGVRMGNYLDDAQKRTDETIEYYDKKVKNKKKK
jgi:hypothetical protein